MCKKNVFEYIVMCKMLFSSEKPPKHDVPDLYRSLHQIRFYLEYLMRLRIPSWQNLFRYLQFSFPGWRHFL
jgi:hypothetical protein